MWYNSSVRVETLRKVIFEMTQFALKGGKKLDTQLQELAQKPPSLRHTFLVVSRAPDGTQVVEESGDIALGAQDRARRKVNQDHHTNVQVFKFVKPRDKNGAIIPDGQGKYALSEEDTKRAFEPRTPRKGAAAPKSDGMTVEQKRKARAAIETAEIALHKVRSAQAYGSQERGELMKVLVESFRRVGWSADEISDDFLAAIENYPSEES